jgi:hypothetical protein
MLSIPGKVLRRLTVVSLNRHLLLGCLAAPDRINNLALGTAA